MGFNLGDLQHQDLVTRSKGFIEEYKKLVELYRCAHRAIIDVQDGGILPKIVVIDATERLEQIKKEAKEKDKKQ